MIFRKTEKDDVLEVLSLYHEAILFMRESGNPNQWTDEESIKNKVLHDIHDGISYVGVDEEGKIQVVYSLLEGEEPTYQNIEGAWKDETSYCTIHKIASRGHHMGRNAIQHCLMEQGHIRIDTHEDNLPMRKTLKDLGFLFCGTIHLSDGSPRLAFEKKVSFEDRLLFWFQEHGRSLPWRENPSPYHVYVSEIMLQQTRAESVKGYYQRFLSLFPNIPTLANAREDVYLKAWEGLGYYSRVRNMHKTALILVNQGKDTLPDDEKELLRLPGIGEYTKDAILSIAYQKKTVAVDGNLLRVYSRLEALPIDVLSKKDKEACRSYLLERLERQPSLFSQALMDLGEIVCLPHGTPLCGQCPFETICKAHRLGKETEYPLPKKKKEKKIVQMSVVYLKRQGRHLILKRPDHGLLAALYEPYHVDGQLNEAESKEALEKIGFTVLSFASIGNKKHVFTHLIWDMDLYEAEVDGDSSLPFIEVTDEEYESTYALPNAFRIKKTTH